jgi:hypothetical protein
MRRLILVLIFLFIIIFNVNSQTRFYPKHQFGLGYSTITSGILSYQIELNPSTALKFGGFAYYTSDNPPDDLQLYGAAGAEYQFNLFKTETDRIYALTGMSFWYFNQKLYSEKKINDVVIISRTNNIKKVLNFGIGAGYELRLIQRVAISFDLGWQLQYKLDGNGNFDSFFDKVGNDELIFAPAIGIGIRYIF